MPCLRSSPPALPPQSPRVLGLGTQLYLGWDLSAPALGFRVPWWSRGRHSRGPPGTSRGVGGAALGAGRVALGSRLARWRGERRPPQLSWKVEVPGRARARQGLHLRAEKKVRRSATLQTPRPLVSASPAPPRGLAMLQISSEYAARKVVSKTECVVCTFFTCTLSSCHFISLDLLTRSHRGYKIAPGDLSLTKYFGSQK